MGSITKRGERYRAQVKSGSVRRTRSFRTKTEARAWISQEETRLSHERNDIPRLRVRELFERYSKEVSPLKKGGRWERVRLQKLSADPLGDVWTTELRPRHVAEWRDRALKEIKPQSVNREWNLLSAVFNVAMREWHWLRENPCGGVKRPKGGKPRDRRPTERELERIGLALGDGPVSSRVRLAMWFAVETAMRAGEIASIGPGDVRGRAVYLDETKNGQPRVVPLSKRAIEILDEAGGKFPSSMQISQRFANACKRAGVEDLTFHDLRREALSRLSKKVDVMQLAKISGHKDVRILLNVYYKPDIDELADLLN